MENQANLFLLLLVCLTTISSGLSDIETLETQSYRGHGFVKLFVFGDSYVDTGNWNRSTWRQPYGVTFPGKPSGRFSDGRVLTDYIASFLGIRSPVPYQWRNIASESKLQFGMNFAYGGSGVFNTWMKQNMKFQIHLLKQLVKEKMYTKCDLEKSIALVSSAGNDYTFFLEQRNGSTEGVQAFTRRIIKRLAKNLKHLHHLGVQKIAVGSIEPTGCLPIVTEASSYQNCSETFNSFAKYHNKLLRVAVHKLNKNKKKPVFFILDVYNAFMSALKQHRYNKGNLEYKNPLKPCCLGVTINNKCAEVDRHGEKKYELCKHPELSFFWDTVHPSQNGWRSVYLALKSSLHKMLLN